MGQILLVDDELLIIEAIKCNIDWETCGVTEVFLCDNGFQAQKIMETQEIDLVISDIQMPGIDGIDFARWIRGNKDKCGIFFLTGYAEFEYAKAAITLGADDYILKPVNYQNLADKIAAYMKQVEVRRKDEQLRHHIEVRKEDLLKEWVQHILNSTEEYYGEDLEKLLELYQLKLKFGEHYMIIWISYSEPMAWDQSEKQKKEKVSARYPWEKEVMLIHYSDKIVFTLIRLDDDGPEVDMEEMRRLMADLISQNQVPGCCFISEILTVDQLIPMFRKIAERDKRNVLYQNKVMLVGKRNIPLSDEKVDIDYKKWSMLLATHDIDQLEHLVELIIHGLVVKGQMDVEMLQTIYNQFNQVIYYYIGEDYDARIGIVRDEKVISLQTGALRSVEGFRAYYHHLLEKIRQYHAAQSSNDVIAEVKKYIDEHIGEKISRTQIAEHVFLNENYLSRLFHKEEGCSISNYILEKRLALSKKLLIQTKLSVSDIGEQVGYDTTTYFIRIFKQETGMTPNEYRKGMRI